MAQSADQNYSKIEQITEIYPSRMNYLGVTLNVITLNCWGIPYVSKNREIRMAAIAAYLARGNYDIVSLQEIWDKADYQRIAKEVQSVLPHSHYFYSGVLGSGVCVFSKWPIEEVFFHPYSLNGYAHMVHHADWFGGKGIGLCKIRCDDMVINFYSAHLHAEYCSEDIYLAHRVIQAYDTAKFIKLTSSSSDVIILAGDLNTQPKDLAYKLITTMTNLSDSCLSVNSQENCEVKGTNEGAWNSYTNPIEAQKYPQGKRIDYILHNSMHNYELETLEYTLPISNNVPGYDFSYSDHDAVATKFMVKKNVGKVMKQSNIPECLKLMEIGVSICDNALSSLSKSKYKYFVLAITIVVILSMSIPWFEGSTVIGIFKLLMLFLLFYFLFMASLWNNMESNAILSAHSGMKKFIEYHKNDQRSTSN